jgi:hypothetical protein
MARQRLGDVPLTAAERQRRRGRLAAKRDAERSHETAQAAELERLNAELAKATRSRDYWRRRVKDDEQRAAYEAQEPLWKVMEANKQKRAGKPDLEDLSAFLERQYEAMRQNYCEHYNLQPKMPLEVWRRLVQLAHPDKHGGSTAAIEATRWLLDCKPD